MMEKELIFREVPASEIKVDSRELSARLGGYCTACGDISSGFIAEILDEASPKYAAVVCEVSYDDDAVIIDGKRIYSTALRKNLGGAPRAYVIAVTLGIEVDRYLKRQSVASPARHFIADGAASALAEALSDICESDIGKDLKLCPRFSPGYADLPLSVQSFILSRLSAQRLLGITLTDSYLMIPTKSITAIIGINE
jgi:hypothetical protein